MPDDLVIETKGLKKTFFSKIKKAKKVIEAVKGVDLSVKTNEIFGFLGPNGAGKSTTQKMLATLLCPTSGQAMILGYDLARQQAEIRQNIGYVSQAGGTDTYVTGRDNLVLQARLYGIKSDEAKRRAEEFTRRFQMSTFVDRVVSSYSGGQKRRLDTALGMVHGPKLLLLDEPTTGLDPQSRAYMWEEIRKLKKDGVTIFMSTHYMDEADKLCDTLAIIDNGAIIRQGTPEELKNSIGADIIGLSFPDDSQTRAAEKLLKVNFAYEETMISRGLLTMHVKEGKKILPAVLRLLDSNRLFVQTVSVSEPSLDDVFLKYTGRSLREDKE